MTLSIQRLLTLLALALVACIAGCANTTQRIGPSEAALNNFGVQEGDVVLIRYADGSGGRSSTSSESIRISSISETGISGIRNGGAAVKVPYHEIYGIEMDSRKLPKISHSSTSVAVGNSFWKALKFLTEVVAAAAPP